MNENIQLTEIQKDTLGKVGNICMSSAAATLHDILSIRVTITAPEVSITTFAELTQQYKTPYVIVNVSYTEGLLGNNVLIIKTKDVQLITSIMLGQAEPDYGKELSELELSTIGEVMNKMMGTSSTALSTLIASPVNVSPPDINVINISKDRSKLNLKDDPIISIKFNMKMEELLDTEIILLMPFDFGKELVEGYLKANCIEDKDNNPSKQTSDISDKLIKQADEKQGNVRSVTLQSFDKEEDVKRQTDNIDLLMDVPLQLTVELGRTKRYLKDILELNLGSIFSLDKPAGDLIDVLVNGKLIAKGEVVVIDDNFGVRITDIISSDRRHGNPK